MSVITLLLPPTPVGSGVCDFVDGRKDDLDKGCSVGFDGVGDGVGASVALMAFPFALAETPSSIASDNTLSFLYLYK